MAGLVPAMTVMGQSENCQTTGQAGPGARLSLGWRLPRQAARRRSREENPMSDPNPALARADAFCKAHDLRIPILLAPMAGACPPSLSIAIANAGGLGACGALLMQPAAIKAWASDVRAGSNGGFQLN